MTCQLTFQASNQFLQQSNQRYLRNVVNQNQRTNQGSNSHRKTTEGCGRNCKSNHSAHASDLVNFSTPRSGWYSSIVRIDTFFGCFSCHHNRVTFEIRSKPRHFDRENIYKGFLNVFQTCPLSSCKQNSHPHLDNIAKPKPYHIKKFNSIEQNYN